MPYGLRRSNVWIFFEEPSVLELKCRLKSNSLKTARANCKIALMWRYLGSIISYGYGCVSTLITCWTYNWLHDLIMYTYILIIYISIIYIYACLRYETNCSFGAQRIMLQFTWWQDDSRRWPGLPIKQCDGRNRMRQSSLPMAHTCFRWSKNRYISLEFRTS